jgi:hypothetical protein
LRKRATIREMGVKNPKIDRIQALIALINRMFIGSPHPPIFSYMMIYWHANGFLRN